MINLHALRESPEKIGKKIKTKDPHFDVQRFIELDSQVRSIRQTIEQVRAEKNELAKKIGETYMTPELRENATRLSRMVKEKEAYLDSIYEEFQQLYLHCPNIPEDGVPVGDEDASQVVRKVGEVPRFAFEPQDHIALGKSAGWLDFDAAAEIAGSHFVVYKNQGALVAHMLGMFMLARNREHGYEPILPPALASYRSLEASGNFPRFQDDVYAIPSDGLYLIPTAEVSLTNMYRDTLFKPDDLPKRMTAFTSCFRREAGGYGAYDRGLIRLHQFEKAELYAITQSAHAAEEQERMLACAESILQDLGLSYRIMLLATGDTSFSSAKTYDIEVWLPSRNEYREVSSISNCTDFQARRSGIRFKGAHEKNSTYAYTLNGSSLAIPRLMVALMETYQQEDGSIALPEVLKHVTLSI